MYAVGPLACELVRVIKPKSPRVGRTVRGENIAAAIFSVFVPVCFEPVCFRIARSKTLPSKPLSL